MLKKDVLPDMGAQGGAHSRYTKYVPDQYQTILRWFHNSRVNSFKDLIEPNGLALSIGCGHAVLERQILSEFDEIVGLEPVRDRISVAHHGGIEGICGAGPPLPFEDTSFDSVFVLGTLEHVEQEQELIREISRVLATDGVLYATLPIEVGFGGLLRHLGRCVVSPEHKQSPDDWRRFIDYSYEELSKSTPRTKHGTMHRYYNYEYALKDIRSEFEAVTVTPWPVRYTKTVNLILMIKATNR